MSKKWMAIGLALLLATVTVFSAGASGTAAHSLASEYDYTALTVGTTTDFSGNFLSPLFGNNGSDIDIRNLLHGYSPVEWIANDGVYRFNNTVVSNVLIEDSGNGGRTYHIFLNSDLYYSDGTGITAADYVFSLLLSADPAIVEIGGTYPGLDCIDGMREYRNGEANSIRGIRLLSDYAFSVTVTPEYLPNFYELGILDIYPWPAGEIAPGHSAADDGEGAYLSGEKLTGDELRKSLMDPDSGYLSHPRTVSGPYTMASYDGNKAVLKINPYFKGDHEGYKPTIQTLTVTSVTNERMIGALADAEFGLLNRVTDMKSIEDGIALVGGNRYQMETYPRSGCSLISFCCERPAVSDVSVRQAIAYCFDKDAAVQAYVGDYGKRVDGYYGIGEWVYKKAAGMTEEEDTYGDDDGEGTGLNGVRVYQPDPTKSVELLETAGWNLNADGGTFDPSKDDIRYKRFEPEGSLVPLSLKLIYPEGNAIGTCLKETLAEPLAKIGIRLELIAVPYEELLNLYYRYEERDCDMIYIAKNFSTGSNLAMSVSTDPEMQTLYNCYGLEDEELYSAAEAVMSTEAGNTEEYCRRWLQFQKIYQEKVPGIGVYSNIYFDFHTWALNGYEIENETGWAKAIVSAYMGDPLNVNDQQDNP